MSLSVLAQPQMIKELPANSAHYIGFKNNLYFAINDELWTSNGSANGTAKVIGLDEEILDIKATENKLFITTSTGNGIKLYVSNGTSAGTDSLTGAIFLGVPNNFTPFDGKVFFIGYSGAYSAELWVTDGTMAGTVLYSALSSSPSANLTVFHNFLYFVSDKKLWKTNSASNFPIMVLQPSDFAENIEGLNPNSFTLDICVGIINDKLIFSASFFDFTTFSQFVKLYSTSGDIADYAAIKEINHVMYVSRSEMFNGKIVISFYGENSVLHPVWITDGSVSGTLELLADVGTDAYTENLIPVGNKMVLAVSGQSVNYLFITDGTPSGSGYFQVLRAGGSIRNMTSIDSKLFFTDHLIAGEYGSGDGINDWEFWQSNLTIEGTQMVRDLTSNSYDSYYGTDNLINVNRILYFSTGNGNFGWSNQQLINNTSRLWKYCEPFLAEVVTSVSPNVVNYLQPFPNPFSDRLTIKNVDGADISVLNALGHIVHQEKNYTGPLDLSLLPEGVYSIKLEGSVQSYKVVKAK